MKKTKLSILAVISIALALSFVPSVVPQVGTYTFHGSAGNVKILKVNTVNNASLASLFGDPTWLSVIGVFGAGAVNVGARSKSLVTAVNTSAIFDTVIYGVYDVTTYNTSNWGFTTGAFSATPDSVGDIVTSFYDPTELSYFIHTLWGGFPYFQNVNVSLHTAGAYLAQLPTSVDQYLGAITWEPKWENIGNTIVHHATMGDTAFYYGFTYLENCTEIWTYDRTYGAWIGYKILDDTNTKIYEFSIELGGIPGFDFSITLGVAMAGAIGIIFVLMKKKKI
jgi:hypothetical protein